MQLTDKILGIAFALLLALGAIGVALGYNALQTANKALTEAGEAKVGVLQIVDFINKSIEANKQ